MIREQVEELRKHCRRHVATWRNSALFTKYLHLAYDKEFNMAKKKKPNKRVGVPKGALKEIKASVMVSDGVNRKNSTKLGAKK